MNFKRISITTLTFQQIVVLNLEVVKGQDYEIGKPEKNKNHKRKTKKRRGGNLTEEDSPVPPIFHVNVNLQSVFSMLRFASTVSQTTVQMDSTLVKFRFLTFQLKPSLNTRESCNAKNTKMTICACDYSHTRDGNKFSQREASSLLDPSVSWCVLN